MASDKLLYEYTTHFPNALAKFLHAETDDDEAKSVTFKEIEKRAEIFLIGRSGQHVILVEPQGYEKDDLYYPNADPALRGNQTRKRLRRHQDALAR